MLSNALLSLAIASLSTITLGQNMTLVDPRTRFAHMNLSLPERQGDSLQAPSLQSAFQTPPDCGETSYQGTGRLRGRRALVTGGDSGIGRAIVIAYAREGANVAINYLPEEESDAQALVDFLAEEGLNITRIPGNLLNETFCTDLVHQAHAALGGLDILINHAGFPGFLAGPNNRPISEQSTEQLDLIFRTNVYAPIFTTRAAVPLMPPGSSLIYTASDAARNSIRNGTDYSASKAAIVSIVRSLGQQLEPLGIRVNGVAPARVYTPFLVTGGYETQDIISSDGSRIEQPAELAPAYVALAASDNTFATGSIWGVNGAGLGF